MAIFEIVGDQIQSLELTNFAKHGVRERTDLQRLLRAQIEIIAPDVLIIAEEFCDWEDSNRRVDLLGIDRDANLVVIELKRTDDGGHMELQAIRYAAMISKMTFEKAVDTFERHLANIGDNRHPREAILEFLGWDDADGDRFAQDVRIVLASADFSRELTSTVLWLNERDLDIRCVRLRPYSDGARLFLDVQQVLPLPEANDYFVSLREKRVEERQARRRDKEWSGLYFVNVGMSDASQAPARNIRHWENCTRYGYVAAGNGPRYSDALRKLKLNDSIVAYQKGVGYVGAGSIVEPAKPVHEFFLENGQSLEDTIKPPNANRDRSPENWEYAVRVDWRRIYPLPEAKTFKGIFAKQHVVCRLYDATTAEFLRNEFEISE